MDIKPVRFMNEDIYLINQVLDKGTEEELTDVHKRISCKYHTRINDFENSMWGYNSQFGFNYEMIGEDGIRDNLTLMKYRIEGYLEDQSGDENMVGGMFSRFPTENLILHKKSGEQLSVVGLVSGDMIGSEDVSVVIEENDVFIRSLPNGAKEYFLVIDRGFMKGTGRGISDHYQTKIVKMSASEYEEHFSDRNEAEKPVKIFISHSSKDVVFIRRLVEFLEDMNVPEEGIFCSSVPEYGIPGGQKYLIFCVNNLKNMNCT